MPAKYPHHDIANDYRQAIRTPIESPNPLQLTDIERWIEATDPKLGRRWMFMTQAPAALDCFGTRQIAERNGWRAILVCGDYTALQRNAYGDRDMFRPYEWADRIGVK